ncbi:septation protein SepH [Kribbella monticola]|uniref:septation protein SepH n=1 Tax=Kribbella monticola TaxID=2185285 RepID=UPI000DD4E740|nr:septation protein SepH [Kribbella monticola]
MREAKLVGLSQDGTKLILAAAETGEEFAVPVDDRLRAALRGDRARLGQLEIQMESALRPRDIQARIRAGESPEAVAAVAQMPMERVMAFAGPVLAERDHVASLAQRASVRRRGGGDAPTRNLGAWVTERLRIRGVDPATAEWDAWRRDDGRWAVRVSYFVDAGEGDSGDEKIAMFAYDAPGRYAVPDDDEARWLVGEQAQVIAPQPTSERRLTAVADFDLSLAPDHGADSYEAGFEDTISLPRGRAHQSDRDANRDTGRGFGRDLAPEYGHEPGREFGRGPGRDASRDVPRSGDAERGARRVHSVPSPDDEPTLIDVPIEPPPSVRPAVRAVERPAQPPVEASPPAPLEERAAAPENRFTERRITPDRPAPHRLTEAQRAAAAPQQRLTEAQRATETGGRLTEAQRAAGGGPQQRLTEAQRAAEEGRGGPRPADPRQPRPGDPREMAARAGSHASADPSRPDGPRPADPRETTARAGDLATQPGGSDAGRPGGTRPGVAQPAAPGPDARTANAGSEEEQAATAAQPAEEPKKKPAKRASKRASVPSWDEIMFGKKAD